MPSASFDFDCPPVIYWNSNPYALAFSPDGATLVVGSGGWYGGGGLSLVDVASAEDATIRFCGDEDDEGDEGDEGVVAAPFARRAGPLTVSGVAFDASGKFLAACTWSSRQHRGPVFLLRVEGRKLEHEKTFELDGRDGIFTRCPTGVCFMRNQLWVRCNARRIEDVLHAFPVPLEVDTNVRDAHRAHARLACAGEELITGGGGSLKLCGWSNVEGMYEASKATTGMVVGPKARAVPAPGARVTAVLGLPDGTLVTGGLTGELVLWERGDEWRPVRWLRNETERRAPIGGAWATYRPDSVVALCALDADRFFSVDASGEVLEWRDGAIAAQHSLPRPGTARAIAVHPDTPRGPLLAVGLKLEGRVRRGYVACVGLER